MDDTHDVRSDAAATSAVARLARVVDDVVAEMDGLAVRDDLSVTDVWRLGREMVALRRQMERCEREIARRAAIFEAHGGYRADGMVNTAAWLAAHTQMTRGQAAAKVRLGERLKRSPAVDEAWASGRIGEKAVSALGTVRSADRDRFEREVDEWIARAETASADDIVKECRSRRNEMLDDRGVDDFNKRHADRSFTAAMRNGTLVGEFRFSDDQAAMVKAALDAGIQMGRDQDEAAGDADARTRAQRAADHVVDMCELFLSNRGQTPAGARVRPTVSAVFDVDALAGADRPGARCDVDRVGPIARDTMKRLCCDSDVIRAVVDADSVPLDLGRKVRTANGHQRRALEIRDGGCRGPGCDRPPWWTDAHHIVHWSEGGSSDLDNLILLCRRHHTLVHEGGWSVSLESDGTVTWTAPSGVASAESRSERSPSHAGVAQAA